MASDQIIYCVKCKRKTNTNNITNNVDRRGRPRVAGNCSVCNTTKYQYIKKYLINAKGIDVHSLIGKLPRPKKGFVLPGYRYCGPYNPLDEQIDEQGNVIDPPKNELDKICMVHDIEYDKAQSKGDKHKADRRMLDSLGKTRVKGVRENIEKKILQGAIAAKYKLGLGLKKKL